MINPIDRPGRALAASALLGALVLASPGHAQTSNSTTVTPPSATSGQPPASKRAAAKPMSRTELVGQRIKELHAKLRITSELEPKWAAVAQVMQTNAGKIDELTTQRSQNLRTMTAVDDLKSYRDIEQARANGAQTLITAFQDLYDSMTPEQKKNADTVFAQAQSRRNAPPRKATKG
jgi:hypothetical protein